jgi:hypothetical protein
LHILPIDEILLSDYYSGTCDIQKQPNIFRVRRIPYDQARAIYAGKYFDGEKEVKHTLLLWQLKWLCWDEIQPLLPTRDEAMTESREIGQALVNTFIPPRDNYKTGAFLEFLFQNQKSH